MYYFKCHSFVSCQTTFWRCDRCDTPGKYTRSPSDQRFGCDLCDFASDLLTLRFHSIHTINPSDTGTHTHLALYVDIRFGLDERDNYLGSLQVMQRTFTILHVWGTHWSNFSPSSPRIGQDLWLLNFVYSWTTVNDPNDLNIFSEGKWRSGADIHRICRRTSETKEYLIHIRV